jgi:hypothetical protein
MKTIRTAILLCLLCHISFAQATAEEALQKVYTTLSLQTPQIHGDTATLLQRGAWEALSYLEPASAQSVDDLQEAVPDYYHFYSSEVRIKLINPENSNEYGMDIQISYRISADAKIQLLKDGRIQQQWQLLYLDANYMALEMGDLRVFFTHTPLQE